MKYAFKLISKSRLDGRGISLDGVKVDKSHINKSERLEAIFVETCHEHFRAIISVRGGAVNLHGDIHIAAPPVSLSRQLSLVSYRNNL